MAKKGKIMKIACTPISCSALFKQGQMDAERFIAFCAEQHIQGVDLLHTQDYGWFWKNAERELKLIRGWVDRAGLALAAYACGNDFAKSDPVEFENSVATVTNALQEAQALGAPLLRIFGGYHRDLSRNFDQAMDYAEGLQRIIQGIERCLPAAEKNGVILALENHGRLPGHSYEIERILQHFNSPWLRCCFDCANFVAGNMNEPEDPLRAYERLAPYVAHVHVKDFIYHVADRRREVEACVPGKGLVPLRQFIAMLEEHDYRGYCSLEYEADRIMPTEQGVPASFAYLRSIAAICHVK